MDFGDILALIEDPAVRRLEQAEHCPAQRAFSAAGFADEAVDLVAVHLQADIVDRLYNGLLSVYLLFHREKLF